jgi:hypothetical protein
LQLQAASDVFRRNPIRRHAPQATESAIREMIAMQDAARVFT